MDLFSYFLLLIMAVLSGALLGAGAGTLIARFYGYAVNDLMQVPAGGYLRIERDAMRWINLSAQLFTFLFPALVFRVLDEKRTAATIIADQRFFWFLILAAFWLSGAFPLVEWLYRQNLLLPLPESLLSMDKASMESLRALLVMDNISELVLNLVVLAAIPALCEEWLFRGVLQQKLEGILPVPWVAVWLSAALFSAIHLQFAGFIPRFFLGALLGYLFYFSRNIWVAIWAHFLFNGSQLIARYWGISDVGTEEKIPNPASGWVIASAVLTLIIFGISRMLATTRSNQV